MIFDALNVGASSLKANQKAIDVVSHNIANVNTPGYSRQNASLVTIRPDTIGNLSFGRGVDVQSVRRVVDPIIDQAQLNNSSQLSFWQQQNSGLLAVENAFGSLQSTGLSAALNDFYLSWQQMANNPQDSAQRVNVRAKASVVVTNLSNMSQQITNSQQVANSKIDQHIVNANSLLDHIATLTANINRQEASAQGAIGQANDLRDQRDQAVRDLAQIIPVQSVSNSNGSFILQTVDGDLLSQDGVSQHLARGTAAGTGFSEVVIAESGIPINSAQQTGSIGGLVDLRDNKLGSYLQQLDSIAANLAFSTNQVHASGTGLNGNTSLAAGQAANTTLPLDAVQQNAPFAAQIKTGSFQLHLYDATGAATPPGGIAIAVTAGVTTMNDIATSLNGIAGMNASIDANGYLSITAGTGNTFRLSDDSSNVLAAYEINSFFQGGDSASITVSKDILNDAGAINTGRVDLLTSASNAGDNSVASAILALQDTQLSVDGTTAFSLHERTTSLSTRYGTDVAVSTQQLDYRTAEAASLTTQRQAVSGVNVDEELISMMKFQRAYEASAKVITTTNQMLDSLMGLIR